MSGDAAWPLVDVHDDGIRPAGKPNACFYCQQGVGYPHKRDCVVVTKRVEMRVHAVLPTGEEFTGLWQFDEVHSWDADQTEFHKNESSWCAGNLLNEREDDETMTWEGRDPTDILVALHASGQLPMCLCGVLRFEFVRVVDPTPRRNIRVPTSEVN
jgi:hypothetical protein